MHLGDALRLWLAGVLPMCLLAFVACRLLVPPALPAWAVAAIVLADLAGASLLELLARTWQAVQRMAGFGAAMSGLIVLRLGVFCALLAVASPGPAQWAAWNGGVTALYVALVLGMVLRRFGWPRHSAMPLRRLAAAGFPFAFSGSALRVQAEANKPILARLDTLAGVGAFTAAQRVTDVFTVPLQAMLETLLPRAYRTAAGTRTVFTLGGPALVLALLGGFLIAAGAPWLPVLLGPSYTDAVLITYILAFVPVVFVVRMLLTTVLAGRGEQVRFYGIYGLGSVASVVGTALLVAAWGARGAAAAVYVPEVAMIALQIGLLARTNRDKKTQNEATVTDS
jgi:O-antigen/teichoic acid export membrane protein